MGLAALGVVFGDIGTSPLYTLKTVLDYTGQHPDPAATLGALSLILWTLLLITTVKYVNIAMRRAGGDIFYRLCPAPLLTPLSRFEGAPGRASYCCQHLSLLRRTQEILHCVGQVKEHSFERRHVAEANVRGAGDVHTVFQSVADRYGFAVRADDGNRRRTSC